MNRKKPELTNREQQVLEFLAQGYLNKNIGAELGISEETVKNYVTSIFRKLNASNRAHAVLLAKESGLLPAALSELITDGCNFNCGKKGEPLIGFVDTASGNQWICHLSCLKEHIRIREKFELPEFRKYFREKYPGLDEDLITMMADLVERETGRLT